MAEKKNTKSTKKTVVKKTATKSKGTTKKSNANKFAVIEIAGTQLKVKEGQKYELKKLSGNKGDKITIENVLLLVDGEERKIGEPYVKDSKVVLEITSQMKGEKMKVFKYKAKSRYRRTYGHRPAVTRVLVKKIS